MSFKTEYNFKGEFDETGSFDDAVLSDINFSEITGGDFTQTFSNLKGKINVVNKIKKSTKKHSTPLTNNIPVRKRAVVDGFAKSKLTKIIAPSDRKLIVEHVDSFILNKEFNDVKRINYNGDNKLKEIILVFRNTGALDFNLQMFNPSMPLDFVHSTSLNLNDKILVAGWDGVSYSDLMFNILANPLFVYNAKIAIAGPQSASQINEPLRFIKKDSRGTQFVHPVQIALQIDNFQKSRDIINFFEVEKKLNRPYIADGMDVIEYKVLAGNTVTIAFFCRQRMLKDLFYRGVLLEREEVENEFENVKEDILNSKIMAMNAVSEVNSLKSFAAKNSLKEKKPTLFASYFDGSI